MSDDKEINNIPRHIAVIPDGNRRFAKKKGLKPWLGHREGSKTYENFLEWCKEFGVKEVSFWAASTENIERDKQETDFLYKLFEETLDRYIKDYENKKVKHKIRIRFIGNLSKLPEKIQEKMKKVEELTKDYNEYKLNMLVAYGGRWEITEAAKRIAKEVKDGNMDVDDITPEVFQQHLELESEPDLIIRTSQERLSGLLPWQCIYSEIIFLKDKHWPEFSKEDFKKCLEEYAKRPRRFGK
ncbi:di-trans,poly-cis-decaprenylcistransferase [Candidatus Woesearchaeota archaeon]|nr:di-trans,poly-cis-decaprenylcistransferase [Candidatus Woesearchaeota archaeon]